ncbi:phosphoadenylyl-sulfate reductase [Rubellicoccus peritrichatus]|uniref:Phosphoadenosine 5'-phosphosulfate reductase n=1 Tax=Rubellicoccus peritrichatus TaxID=3080537 RepID=A0AAQ3LFV9_9BACT|nr:phosphoadenylyl-sulfate reductase [Puniceicoccus sp. CR14]WOO43090.1 phosphoadenylyl-sulfate reductase [Puniceicoccus sp. CR14]
METLTVDLPVENQHLESTTASQRVRWALDEFGDELAMSTSFGVQSAATLHLVTSIIPDIPVIFIDTGYLFPETYRFADELTERLKLNLKVYTPKVTAARQEALWGKRWEKGVAELEAYNLDNKVEPMNRAFAELGAVGWISGLRRAQSTTRQHLRVAERQNKTFKIHPIIDWNDRDVYQYLTENGLPYHPLWDEGYVSVGDVHSTSKLGEGMSAEETRFNGMKRECGLHELSNRVDFQI